jgi:serine/threonine protein kinase
VGAVEYLHSLGIVHRDLKVADPFDSLIWQHIIILSRSSPRAIIRGNFLLQPENIVFKFPPPCPKVVIVDFNLACLVEPAKLKVLPIHLCHPKIYFDGYDIASAKAPAPIIMD